MDKKDTKSQGNNFRRKMETLVMVLPQFLCPGCKITSLSSIRVATSSFGDIYMCHYWIIHGLKIQAEGSHRRVQLIRQNKALK